MDQTVTEINGELFAALRDGSRVTVEGLTFAAIHEQDGVHTYYGVDRDHAMGLTTRGGKNYCVILPLRLSQRWVCDNLDRNRSSRWIAGRVIKALPPLPAPN